MTKAARQAAVAAILAETSKPVRSQEQLVERLAAQGVLVTQATLSRDLDEIGAVRLRGPDGALVYALPPDQPDRPSSQPVIAPGSEYREAGGSGASAGRGRTATGIHGGTAALGRVAAGLLLSAEASGNLVVLKTPPGAAQLLGSMIDRSGMTAVLGTVAGDDTVLVVARDPAGGEELASTFLRLAERRHRPAGHGRSEGKPG
ncbi:MAG TPA: arginine repressor [Streptosporangiaceae bacterium]|nr:arginine repressor [Streptosporangiaceae bacterium]